MPINDPVTNIMHDRPVADRDVILDHIGRACRNGSRAPHVHPPADRDLCDIAADDDVEPETGQLAGLHLPGDGGIVCKE